MKYMLMMNAKAGDWANFDTMSMEDIQNHIRFMHDLNDDLAKAGELVDAQGLAGPAEARIIRASDDGTPITDGPFAETKEFLAGYWIVDVESTERAIEIATHVSGCPGASGVKMNIPVELRQVMDAPPVEV